MARKRLQFHFSFLTVLSLCSCVQEWNKPADTTTEADVTDDTMDGAETADTSGDCPTGLTECGGECVNTGSDHSHCGGCGNDCAPVEVCSGGACLLECPSGEIACNGSCVNIDNDIFNCGGCGIVCTAGENADPLCDMRICTVRCREGWSDMDGDGSCETNCIPTSTTEICNGIDDNCDGNIDENFDCRMGRDVACTTVCGSTGAGLCTIDCSIPGPSLCTPHAEICNGADDDCDGVCDNGFACCSGSSGACTTSCGTNGTRQCSAVCMWSDCIPPGETCNGIDDDCSGACDDGPGMACCRGTTESCTTSCGSTGTRTCSSSCVWGTCNPPSETCNGADDDCDGVCDNGFACCRGSSGACTTSCGSTGTGVCSSSCSWGSCTPPSETCNGVDDDCDGDIDEGYRASNVDVTYTTLQTYNSGCNSSTGRWGLACNDAIHRYCISLGCNQSGFGPVENSGNTFGGTCVAGVSVINTTYTVLSSYHGTCTSVNPIGPDCSAAIARYCIDNGYVSGFGPVYASGNSATITCLTSGTNIITTYTVLATHYPSCDGSTERWGQHCNAAINRFCRSEGYTGGFGPIENWGDNAWVTCVSP